MRPYNFSPNDRVFGCLLWEEPLAEISDVVRMGYREFYSFKALRSVNWKWLWKKQIARSTVIQALMKENP